MIFSPENEWRYDVSELPLKREGAILTMEDVRRWRAERDRLQGEIRERMEKLERVDRYLNAAKLFLEAEEREEPTAHETGEIAGKAESMADGILRILQGSNAIMKPTEIRSALMHSDAWAKQLERNPNYFYTVLSRLRGRGKIVKTGKRYRAFPESKGAKPDERTHQSSAP